MSNSSVAGSILGIVAPMTGATQTVAGTAGSVPAPAMGDQSKALLGSGLWGDVAGADTVQTLTATGTVTDWASLVLVDATAGNVTVTLPAASGGVGKTIKVVKTDASSNTVTIASGDTVSSIVPMILGQMNQAITVEAATSSSVRTVANMANAVLAEYGAVALDNQVFNTGTFVNSTNGVYAIPSAGIWLLTYDLVTDGTGANSASQVAIHSPTATVVPGSERTRGGGVTTVTTLTCTILLSTTGPATYRLVGRHGGSGSMTIVNSVTNQSGITWQKIGGFSPVTGAIVDYVQTTPNATSTGLFTGTPDVIGSSHTIGNIPYNPATGVYTLAAGKTYRLNATLALYGAGGNAQYAWVDSDTNVALYGAISKTNTFSADTGVNTTFDALSDLIYTPTANQTIKLRFTGLISVSGFNSSNYSNVTITQIGNSATTSFTGATSTTNGSGGFVPTPVTASDGERKVLVGDGTWNYPSFVGARRFASAATSIPNGSVDTLVTTGTVDFTVGDISTATANQITINVTGYYSLHGSVGMNTNAATSDYQASVRVNGTIVALGGFVSSVSAAGVASVTRTRLLTAGDIVTLGMQQSSGGSFNTVASAGQTFLEVVLLGVA